MNIDPWIGALIALHVVCALGAAISAVQKHRSAGAWLLLGLVFGLLGLASAAVMEDGIEGRLRKDMKAGRVVSCPECTEPVRREALRCKHCGAALCPDTARTVQP